MNLLYIGTWAAHDPLSRSTILPHLEILSKLNSINKIVYSSLEREIDDINSPLLTSSIQFRPFRQDNGYGLIENFIVYYRYYLHLKRILDINKIDLILCRGALAGSLGYKLSKFKKTRFYVESFEPHAQYMKDAGAWRNVDPRYIVQAFLEKKQKQFAYKLLPVSENYRQKLIEEGVDSEKIRVLPCTTDTDFFKPDPNRRLDRCRSNLASNQITGVYVGKFGDIYLYNEAFALFEQCFRFFKDRFRLIILSPNQKSVILKKLYDYGIDSTKVIVDFVDRTVLREYLSASSFAFCTVKPGRSRRFCCPVKNGEYWAMGLPVIIPKNIGDDSELIEKHRAGIVLSHFDPEYIEKKLGNLLAIMNEEDHKDRIRKLAIKYRNRALVHNIYAELFGDENMA